MSDDTQARKEAEAFADYFETAMREFGVTGDYFSPQQRERWRQDAVAAHMGPQPGDEMEDGTILAGYYEGRPLYTTPKDAPGTYTFNEAARYAKNLDAHGHYDFHAPSKGELNVLWENRNKGKLKGTFNAPGSEPASCYWSSLPHENYCGWVQYFIDAPFQNTHDMLSHASLRCVR